MQWHIERLMLRIARWLIVRVERGGHSLCFQVHADDARLEVDTLLSRYYRAQR